MELSGITSFSKYGSSLPAGEHWLSERTFGITFIAYSWNWQFQRLGDFRMNHNERSFLLLLAPFYLSIIF